MVQQRAVAFGGQFENLERARTRLLVVVPQSLFLILVLLFTTFGSVKQAALVFTGISLAAVGGVLALALRGMPLSISAAVGFIALFGVAVLNTGGHGELHQRPATRRAPSAGSGARGLDGPPAPVVTTAPSLGFIPMALSMGAGAEVQRALATVVIWRARHEHGPHAPPAARAVPVVPSAGDDDATR